MKFIKKYWVVFACAVIIATALYLDYGIRQKQKELEKRLIELNK